MLPILFLGVLSVAAELPANLQNGAIYSYKAHSDFASVKQNLETAITNRGLTLRDSLHIAEMLQRTAKATGAKQAVYGDAEVIEFCSAALTQRFVEANPANIALCPLTIAVYRPSTEPQQVYVSFRKPQLASENPEVSQTIEKLLKEIVEESL
ncbi:MAG: DUF302 domain-containing protein [Thiotrichaceae bacterium]|nr:DUF302 domain-containing protein [Thiotrichaceae bacterium]